MEAFSGIYEPIDHSGKYPAKVFVASMENSSFHWHYDYELIVVLRGSLQVFSGPQPQQMQAGDICLINCKTVHGYRAGEGKNLCLFIQFPPTTYTPSLPGKLFYHFYLNSSTNEYPPKGGYTPLVETAAGIGWHNRQTELSHLYRTQSLLYKLFADLLDKVEHDVRRGPRAGADCATNQLAADISAFVDTHCEREQLLQDVCAKFAISEKTLYRYMKNELGVSPKELIDNARVEKSKKLLRQSELGILDIAQQCGYVSNATFYRVFKKAVGVTPKEYRAGGGGMPVGGEVQGYLSFDSREADSLLAHYAGFFK